MDKRNSLIEKYLEGDTSLAEEKLLFSNSADANPDIALWAQYVKQNKKVSPPDFSESLWVEGKFQESGKSRKYIYIIAIALIIGLIVMIVNHSNKSKSLDYAAKKELLDQAIAMTAPESEIPQNRHIIYEDEVLIIYIPKP